MNKRERDQLARIGKAGARAGDTVGAALTLAFSPTHRALVAQAAEMEGAWMSLAATVSPERWDMVRAEVERRVEFHTRMARETLMPSNPVEVVKAACREVAAGVL